MKKITKKTIAKFKEYLICEEKSQATVDKYVRDVTFFMNWLNGESVSKAVILKYKHDLTEKYAPSSVNAALSSLNSFFIYNKWYDCKVKALKIQRQIFANKDKELTKAEYERLLTVAQQRKNQQLYYLIQTICGCGIRVSELKYITYQSLMEGKAMINCKGKMRVAILEELEGLKRDWKTDAGKVFFAEQDTDWTSQVENYVKITNAIADLLNVAITGYESLVEEAKALKL